MKTRICFSLYLPPSPLQHHPSFTLFPLQPLLCSIFSIVNLQFRNRFVLLKKSTPPFQQTDFVFIGDICSSSQLSQTYIEDGFTPTTINDVADDFVQLLSSHLCEKRNSSENIPGYSFPRHHRGASLPVLGNSLEL